MNILTLSISALVVVGIVIGYIICYFINKPKKNGQHKENINFRVLNKVLKLSNLRLFDISISWLKGFGLKVEFFDKKEKK